MKKIQRYVLSVPRSKWVKQRLYLHRSGWNSREFRGSCGAELSKHVWTLKNQGVPHSISWKIVTHAKPFQCSGSRCYLCLNEKLYIATHEDPASLLNKRNELVSKCRHKNKFALINSHKTKKKKT